MRCQRSKAKGPSHRVNGRWVGAWKTRRANGFMVAHSFRSCLWQAKNVSDFLIKEKEGCTDSLGHPLKGKEAEVAQTQCCLHSQIP